MNVDRDSTQSDGTSVADFDELAAAAMAQQNPYITNVITDVITPLPEGNHQEGNHQEIYPNMKYNIIRKCGVQHHS